MPKSNPRRDLLVDVVHIQPDTAPPSRKDARRANRAQARALSDDPLLTVTEAAAEKGVGVSTFWKHVRSGRFPAPEYPLPRCPRWRRSVVRGA
jgi:predicted DNA-binding transcriptional regulator AlpA